MWAAQITFLNTIILSGPGLAQTASQITRPSFRPQLETAGGSLSIVEGNGADAPAGSDRLSVNVRTLTVEGTFGPLRPLTEQLGARLSHRSVTVAEIFSAARDLERAYVAAGFALARVVVPAQTIVNGSDVRLVVIDGFIERIDASAVPPAVRDRIADLLGALVGQRGISLSLIERRLLLAGDLPGTVLRSTLRAGSVPGASVLVVEARYKPVSGFVSLDNALAASLGSYTAGVGLDLNAPTGHGEDVYLRASGYPVAAHAGFLSANPRNRALAVGLVAPLGLDGLTFNVEATDARATPKASSDGLGFTSDFSRLSARIRYPVVRSRALTVNAEADIDAQEERLTAIEPLRAPISLDRLRIARTGGDVVWFTSLDGVVAGRLTGSFGIDGLGAREAPGVGSGREPLSRLGSGPAFQKLEASLAFTQPVFEHLSVDLRARAQSSFNQALPRSEQIGLASASGLSTFDAGQFQGDGGYVARGELQFPSLLAVGSLFAGGPLGTALPATLRVAPYGFGAFGTVRLVEPTRFEKPVVRGSAYGVGLRLDTAADAGLSGASFGLEYGRASRSDGQPTGSRFTFSLALQF